MKKRSEETKKRLVEAALEVFTEKGFAGASTREIVELSRVSKPTLYYYFKNKENLYRALLEETFDRFNREIALISGESSLPRKKLLGIVEYHIQHCRDHPREVKLILMNMYRCDTSSPDVNITRYGRPSVESIAAVIGEGIASGFFVDRDPVRLSLQLIGMIHIQVILMLREEGSLPLSAPEEIVDTFLGGITRR